MITQPVLVVLQDSRGAANPGGPSPSHDTIVLVGSDGKELARATFKPRTVPVFVGAATIAPKEAFLAAGAAYYADGDSVVWRLAPGDTSPTRVADFSTDAAQHMTAFAVSPDGKQVIATVTTFGKRTACAGSDGCIQHTEGPSVQYLEVADVGGSTRVLWQHPLDFSSAVEIPEIAGWDDGGPLMASNPPAATQNTWVDGWASPVAHVDASGSLMPPLGGAGCPVAFRGLQNGDLLCGKSQYAGQFSLVTPSGEVVWTTPETMRQVFGVWLSPTGDFVTYSDESTDPPPYGVAWTRDGRTVQFPSGYSVTGFAGSDTVVLAQHEKLFQVRVSDPLNPAPLPVSGQFAGAILP